MTSRKWLALESPAGGSELKRPRALFDPPTYFETRTVTVFEYVETLVALYAWTR